MPEPAEDRRDGPPPDARPGDVPLIPAERLFSGGDEILIAHNNEVYRLRITRRGRLILTK